MTQPQARRHGDKPFVLTRTLAAPRARVWAAWTQVDELKRWFGPKGMPLSHCALDLRPGGTCLYAMRLPDGREMWGKWTFREIAAPERLVLISSFSDAAGGITRHPMSPTWPQETLSTTTLTKPGPQETRVEIRSSVWNATPDEHATFDAAHDGMKQGWAGTMEQLVSYLART